MKVTQREKRFLLLLGFSAVLFAFLNYVALPWGEQFMTSKDQLMLADKELRHKKELVASAPQVDAQLKLLQARLDEQEKRLLPTPDPNQAAAQLQNWVSQRAAEQKVEVLRADFLAVAPVGNSYAKVPVKFEINAPITQVVQLMNALTHGDRIISIDELAVNSNAGDKEKKVRCTLIVSALMAKAS